MRIIVDAMGGDNAPEAVVKGALSVHGQGGVEIILAGREEEILAAAGGSVPAGVQVVDAREVIEICDDPATAFKRKKDSSVTVGLTMLKNRRVFEADFQGIPEHKFEKCAIAMFDLNNLKKVNDLFGHGMGDCYIITGSEIIRDVFGEFGEIYRIGGDEFCLISERITSRVFQEKEEDMCRRLESLKGIQTSIKEYMQIASGCAVFDRKMDRNLQDTLGRADKQMYQCKKRQKEQKTGGV